MSEYQGMRWLKCDLHVHTPEDGRNWVADDPLRLPEPRRPKVNGQPQEDALQEKARQFLRRCHDLELDVVGVTDHNFSRHSDPRDWFLTHLIDQNETVAEEAGRAALWLFPGFEIDIGYHVLCLFAPVAKSSNLTAVNEALTTLGLGQDQRFDKTGPSPLRREGAYVALRDLLSKVQDECQGIVIAAHAFGDDGIAHESRDAEDYQNEALLAVEVSRWPVEGRPEAILSGRDTKWRRDRPPAPLMSSDAKSTLTGPDGRPRGNSLGHRFSWIKMSQPSVESLRQAFLDHESRIRLQDKSPKEKQRHGRIVSLSVRDTRFLRDQTVCVSPNLTCLIGGRGAGKSTLIEYLRMLVRQEDDPGAKSQIERLRKTLRDDSVLRMTWRADGIEDHFEYGPGLPKAQVIGREVDDPATVFRGLGIQIFSQHQISEIAKLDENRQPSFLLPLVDRLCGEKLVRLKQQEQELRQRIEGLLQQQQVVDRLTQEEKALRQELTELDRQWSAQAAVQEEAGRHRLAQDAKRYADKVLRDAQQRAQEWCSLAEEAAESHAPLGAAARDWPCPDYFARLDRELEQAKRAFADAVRLAAHRFLTEVRQLTVQSSDWPGLQTAIAQAEQEFAAACSRANLQPEDVGRMQEIEKARRAKSAELDAKHAEKAAMEKDVSALDSLRGELLTLWQEQAQVRTQRLSKVLDGETVRRVPVAPAEPEGQKRPFVEATLHYSADRSSFLGHWNEPEVVPDRRTGLGRQWEGLGKALFAAFCDGATASGSPWELLVDWLEDSSRMPGDLRQLHTALREHLTETRRDAWNRLRLTRVRDSVDLKLYRADGTLAGSLQAGKLSDGQRNTAVLSLLLAQGNGPVVIDQPEDELDADFIFNELVPLLRQIKQHRQIILATHNANLPVNADAELVYALETKDGQGVVRAQGGLDRDDVKRAVLDIMEGSEDAFRRRREKYHF